MESLKHEQVVMKQKQEALSQVILHLIITVFLLKVFLSVSLDLVGLEKRFKLLSKIKYNMNTD